MVIFKFLAKEIFKGMRDLLQNCTYAFKMPIGLHNIYAIDKGTQVVFSNLEFTERRCKMAHS